MSAQNLPGEARPLVDQVSQALDNAEARTQEWMGGKGSIDEQPSPSTEVTSDRPDIQIVLDEIRPPVEQFYGNFSDDEVIAFLAGFAIAAQIYKPAPSA